MKKFVKNLLIFSTIVTIIFALTVISNFYLIKSESLIKSNQKKIIVLGDSNIECAIDDSIFFNAQNLSASSDSYYYSYLKIKKILNNKNNIDTILLAFAPHNIFDNGWLLSESHIYTRFATYYPLMNWDDFSFLFFSKPKAVISAFPRIIKQSIINFDNKFNPPIKDFTYGGFDRIERNVLPEVRKKLIKGEKMPFFKIPDNFEIAKKEVLYLNKIINLCNSKQKVLFLINTPKRIELLNYPKYGVKEFNAFYLKNYKSVHFIDLSKMDIPEDCFGDFVHLNSKGSKLFSNILQYKRIEYLYEIYGVK